MRTTLTIDDDIFQAARAQAQASGRKLGEVISLFARRGMQAAAETVDRRGLPVFKVTKDAAVIPSNRARELLAEDAT